MAQITKPFLQALRTDLEAAMAEVAKKHGIVLRVGNCSFTETTAKFALEVAALGEGEESGDVATLRARQDWKTNEKYLTAMYGLKPEWLGQSFTYGGKTYTVLGLMPKRQKYPVYVRNESEGKNVLLTAEGVVGGFAKKGA